MSFGNLSYLIDDKIFNITFHSSNMSQTGLLPFWTLYITPTNYGNFLKNKDLSKTKYITIYIYPIPKKH